MEILTQAFKWQAKGSHYHLVKDTKLKFYIIASLQGFKPADPFFLESYCNTLCVKIKKIDKNKDVSANKNLKLLKEALREVSRDVYLENSKLKGFGHSEFSITCAFILDGRLYCAHVGDNKLVLLRENITDQLTDDHNIFYEFEKKNISSEDFPYSNALTRSIGKFPELDVDSFYIQLKHADTLVFISQTDKKLIDKLETMSSSSLSEFTRQIYEANHGKDGALMILNIDSSQEIPLEQNKEIEYIELLFKIKFFSDFNLTQLSRIYHQCEELIFEKGELIHSQTENHLKGIFIITSGEVVKEMNTKKLISFFRKDIFLIKGHDTRPSHLIQAFAQEKTKLLYLSRKRLEKLLIRYPWLGQKFHTLIQRIL